MYYQTKLASATQRIAELEEALEGKQIALDRMVMEMQSYANTMSNKVRKQFIALLRNMYVPNGSVPCLPSHFTSDLHATCISFIFILFFLFSLALPPTVHYPSIFQKTTLPSLKISNPIFFLAIALTSLYLLGVGYVHILVFIFNINIFVCE